MNKIKYLLFIFLTLILIKMPEVYAKGKVEIESINLINKSEDTIINSEPSINGLNTSFDLGFKNINDFAKYKVVISNTTDEDYEINDKVENTSEYITYEYSFENNENIVKKNSKLIVFITIKYNIELSTDKFENGEFKEDNNIIINLSNKENSTANPNTNDKINTYLIIVLLTSVAIVGLILTKKTHDKKYLSLLIISLTLIPTSIYALKKIKITINAKTTIYQKYSIYYKFYRPGTGIYIKESDKDKIIDGSCDETPDLYVIQEDNSRVPYINCTSFLYKHDKQYIANEEVEFNEFEFETAEPNGQQGYLCDFDDTTYITTCSNEVRNQVEIKDTYKTFFYDLSNNSEYKESDYEIMNFSNKQLTKHDEHGIIFGVPNKFKMLNHDIILNTSTVDFETFYNPTPLDPIHTH